MAWRELGWQLREFGSIHLFIRGVGLRLFMWKVFVGGKGRDLGGKLKE